MANDTDKSEGVIKSPPATCSAYALLVLKNLNIKRFNNHDDMMTAINALQSRGEGFVPLKYHNGAETYMSLEVWQ